MPFEALIEEGLVARLPGPAPKQAQARLGAARRDLAAAAAISGQSEDWAYAIAYNAAMQAGRALMLHLGYRPTSGEGAHVAVVQSLAEAFADKLPDDVALLETMRRKRHRAVYEEVGGIGKGEVRAAREAALRIYEAVRQVVTGALQLDLDE
jgi:uncharacterized protein (UPF0332 family)